MYYRKFRYKLIVFASGVHLNIFIESHYMDQSAIIFFTNSTIKQIHDCYLETSAKKKKSSDNDTDSSLKW